MRIRQMAPEDLDAALAVYLSGGWEDLRQHYIFYLRHEWQTPFVAEEAGEVIGAGVATQYGATGWLGQIMVAPTYRSRGVGEAITRRLMDHLRAHGCRSLALTATPMGQPLYLKLGFMEDGAYHLFHGPCAPEVEGAAEDGRLRRLTAADLIAICALDREASGEDRTSLIRSLVDEGADGWLIAEANAITGYALQTPWGNRAVIAANADDAQMLLNVGEPALTTEGQLTAFVPTEDVSGRDALAQAGYVEFRQSRRMIWGDPIPRRPQLIWGAYAMAMG